MTYSSKWSCALLAIIFGDLAFMYVSLENVLLDRDTHHCHDIDCYGQWSVGQGWWGVSILLPDNDNVCTAVDLDCSQQLGVLPHWGAWHGVWPTGEQEWKYCTYYLWWKKPSNDFQETFRSCADISITGRQDEELKTGRDKIQTLKKLYLLMKKSEKVGRCKTEDSGWTLK